MAKRDTRFDGIFIKNDIHNYPCYIGDRVKITRSNASFNDPLPFGEDEQIELKEQEFTGILVLHLSAGLKLKIDGGGYISPKLSGQSYIEYQIEKIHKPGELKNKRI